MTSREYWYLKSNKSSTKNAIWQINYVKEVYFKQPNTGIRFMPNSQIENYNKYKLAHSQAKIDAYIKSMEL